MIEIIGDVVSIKATVWKLSYFEDNITVRVSINHGYFVRRQLSINRVIGTLINDVAPRINNCRVLHPNRRRGLKVHIIATEQFLECSM